MIIQKKLNISLSGNTLPMPVRVVEADNAYQLILKYIDFDIPEGAVATMFVKKPSGKFVYQEDNISIEGNVVTIDVDNQAIIEDGISPFQVELKKDGKILTTFINYFHVEKNLKNPNAEESKTVIRALDALIDEKYEELMGRLSSLGVKGFTTIKATNNDRQNYSFITAENAESTLCINTKKGISVMTWMNGDTGEGNIEIQCDEKYFDEKYGTQEGVSEELKDALKTYFTNMQTLLAQIAYVTENNLGNTLVQNAKDVVSALDNLMVEPDEPSNPDVTLSQISATYTGGSVAVGTNVNTLTGLTVKATYSDGSTSNVTGYSLSGTIKEGSNTITVSYGGKTTTFTVIGVASEEPEEPDVPDVPVEPSEPTEGAIVITGLSATDDGNGNVTVTNATATDDGNGNVTVAY